MKGWSFPAVRRKTLLALNYSGRRYVWCHTSNQDLYPPTSRSGADQHRFPVKTQLTRRESGDKTKTYESRSATVTCKVASLHGARVQAFITIYRVGQKIGPV